jgi:peptidoglycan/LPS O-acetylase OafA/YrhL
MIQANVPVRAGNGRRNIEAFTSLRGFASAIVVMAHVWSILDLPRLLAGNPSLVSSSRFVGSLLNGSAAVQIFFVLSACVLAVSSGSHSGTQHAPWITRFYVRRVFRIYPALWVSIVMTICLWHIIRSPQGFNSGLYSPWAAWQAYPSAPTPKLVALSMLGFYVHLNGPLWTLRIELFYSLAFPVIYLLVRDPHKRLALLAGLLLLALLPIPRVFSVHYAFAFGLGAAIPFLPSARNVPYRTTAAIALIALLFTHMTTDKLGMHMKAEENVEMLISFVVVYCLYHSQASMPALENRPFAFIGDISYSVYVLHFPILFALTPLVIGMLGTVRVRVHPLASVLVLAVIVLCTTIVTATLSRRYVERPGERLGKVLYNARKGRRARASALGKSRKAADGSASARD